MEMIFKHKRALYESEDIILIPKGFIRLLEPQKPFV